MKNVVLDVIIFDVVHQMSSVAFDLFGRRDGTEDNFRESLAGKHTETNPTDRTTVFDKSQRSVFA